MKNIRKTHTLSKLLKMLIISFLLFAPYVQQYSTELGLENNEKRNQDHQNVDSPNNAESHAPISITSDGGFPAVSTGSGISDDPYIIENYEINGGGGDGIYIANTISYFIIRNCTISNSRNGISLNNIGSGTATIENNTIHGCRGTSATRTGNGIYLNYCDETKISNNLIYDNLGGTAAWSGTGMVLDYSDNCDIIQNTIHQMRIGGSTSGSGDGMLIASSSSNYIADNHIYDLGEVGSGYSNSINGIHVYNGVNNILLNNTIHDVIGSTTYNYRDFSGNGIWIEEGSGHSDGTQIINNTIYEISGSNGELCGNGIAVWGDDNIVENLITGTRIEGNVINQTQGNNPRGGNGICLYDTEDNVISNNTISGSSGYNRGGNGILAYHIDSSTISNNIISDTNGGYQYCANGIAILYGTYVTISNNEIMDTRGGWETEDTSSGNGILFYSTDYSTISMNVIINATLTGPAGYSGWGIILEYGCDFNDVISNNITSQTTHGIAMNYDFDYNRIMYNRLEGSAGIYCQWKTGTADSSYNEFIGNICDLIYPYSGTWNTIEDNTVRELVLHTVTSTTIVGNLKPSGESPDFTYYSCSEGNQYWLKVISPAESQTYRGIGGIELKFKWQYLGYDLSYLQYVLGWDGGSQWDYSPRPDGVMYIPWKNVENPYIRIYANYTNNPNFQKYSPLTYFTYESITPDNLMDITRNEQEGGADDPNALSYHISSGSGSVFDPYIIENKYIVIPDDAPTGTAGISIQNTDAHFILKDSVISGSIGHHGIMLYNVKNAQFDNVSIIGLSENYHPTDNSAGIERGIYLDSNSANNNVRNCKIYRTTSAGLMVEGDNNYFYNNIISNAQRAGLNISGDWNTVISNDIATFGGPDSTNFYYKQGIANNLSGVILRSTASQNLIEDNNFGIYPTFGINVEGSLNEENTIVDNTFEECATNIIDSGTNTHFLKISTPTNGAMYTGSTPLSAFGFYSGTDGFQDIEDGDLPEDWALSGDGINYLAEVVEEKTDANGYQHKKVLYSYTGEGITPELNVTRDFGETVTSGTCEFWVLKNGDIAGAADIVFGGPSGDLFSILLDSGNFMFTDNLTTNDTGETFQDDYWYRLSVDFSDDGTYVGLGAHQYRFRIYNSSGEGLIYESLNANYTTNNNCSGIRITAQGGPASTMTLYGDAFGYTWHTGYTIGDNMQEGMLISQSQQLGFKEWTWVGYSLNGEPIITLPSFGDVIIPLPNSLGVQTLQLFANDSIDYQTSSPINHFTYNFDRKINIWTHFESGEIVAEFTDITGRGVIKMDPETNLNITVSYSTEKSGSTTYTNASVYYKISQGSWVGPFSSDSNFGTYEFSYILDASNYVLGDTVDYYIGFQQYDASGRFLQQYYWTQEGLKYFDFDAQEFAFHKKVSPIPYQLTLNYSVFYQAEREEEVESDIEGYTVTMRGMAPVAMANFSVNYYNTTSNMTEFSATFDDCVSDLNHIMNEMTCNILETSTNTILEQDGAISPFMIPSNLALIESVTNISVPIMMFESIYADIENSLVFTGEILDLTYKGINDAWFYGEQGLKEFEYNSGDIFANIRFDAVTGIMVYYNYNDLTENETKNIYFGLAGNNQSYPINLNIERREELDETTQDFVDVTLDGILYDPPGDHSYTQMSAGTSITTGWSLETQLGTDYAFESQILVAGLGVQTDEYEIKTEGSLYELEMTTMYHESLTSSVDSDNPALIGPGGGDLYYGTGTYIFYYFYVNNYYFAVNASDPINLAYNDIRVFTVGSRIEYKITPNTSFSVLGGYLDDLNMAELEDENIFADNEITGAERMYTEELENSPYFWTPSSIYEFDYSSSISEMKGFHSYMEYSSGTYFAWNQYLAMSLGGSAGVGVEVTWAITANLFSATGKVATLNTWSRDFLSYTTVSEEEQILVHLEDDDGSPLGEHDQFKMRIFKDKRYNSIGFLIDSDSTYTSYPHERFSGDRRSPSKCEFVGIDAYIQGLVPLTVNARDDELTIGESNNIFKVNFYFDDDPVFGLDSLLIGTHGTPDKTESDDPEEFQVVWDCSLLQGVYYLFAEAWDYGTPTLNFLLSEAQLVYVDNNIPSICQALSFEAYTGVYNLYANVLDGESGIAYVEYWDGDPSSTGTYLGTSQAANELYSFMWATDPEGSEDGTHNIFACAYDRAGNFLMSNATIVEVDNRKSIVEAGTGAVIGAVAVSSTLGGIAAIGLSKVIGKYAETYGPTALKSVKKLFKKTLKK